ncbi:MAG: NAD(P)/FAD-dependent oxidoreductase [Acidobacteriota bacterium]|nr:NAD(P)/FAD-dependent oxidoreductase [Acidobacteriota bacterium]MDQ2840083.1 NAD(P)/FAD-dependent oxidoreductase [Acidobacteriota bacterium]
MNRKVSGVIIGFIACVGWDLSKRISVRNNRGIAKGKRFLVVGGGFAGVEVARGLERLLPGEDNGELTLVNQTDYLLFTPMLTEAVGADVEPHHIIVPLDSFVRRTNIVVGEVKKIDLKSRTVSIDGQESRTLSTDHLILALGASSNFHHVPGAEESAITMKTLEDANRVKEGALALVKRAASERNSEERAALLTFVVAGGGYTGVETIAALNDLVREAARRDGVDESEIRMTIAEPLGRLMSEVTEDLANYSQKQLQKAGIRVLLNTGVKSAQGDTIELSNGEKIQARTFIWTAGVEANKLIGELDAPKGKGTALKVTPTLSVEEFNGVWALGDCAAIPEPNGKGTYAPTAQNATREGKLVARNIVRSLRGQQQKPFTYTPIGQLALVGRHRGVARVYNQNFSGFIAYAMWRMIYLAKMPSMTQRLRVLSDWCLDSLLGPVAKLHPAAAPKGEKVGPSKQNAASAR